MIKAVFPGSFDPVTLGHLDIIERAAKITDMIIVLVCENSVKQSLFTLGERAEHLRYLTNHLPNANVDILDGLAAEYARNHGARMIIRSLRCGGDFDYETQVAGAYKKLSPELETVYLSASPEYSYLSSTVVREFIKHGANIDEMVHNYIKIKLIEKQRGSVDHGS